LLALLGQKAQEVIPNKDVKIYSHFIEKEYIPRTHETHTKLDTPSLAIRDRMHMPIKVDIEDIKKSITTLLMPVATDTIEKM
jgi:hypothetical protein